jgi:protein dithiol:quinone oxidoreductase
MRLLQTLVRRRRTANLVAALVCFAMVGFALYSQYYLGYEPCPLCIFERLAITGLGIAFLLAVIPGEGRLLWHRVFALLIGAVALAGVGISGRHVYIQHLPPDKVPVCGATLEYMREVFPLADVIRKVLTGSGECAKIDWTFLGLSMPEWVLIWALLLGGAGVALNWVPSRFRQAASLAA